jgi:hypothetical protein
MKLRAGHLEGDRRGARAVTIIGDGKQLVPGFIDDERQSTELVRPPYGRPRSLLRLGRSREDIEHVTRDPMIARAHWIEAGFTVRPFGALMFGRVDDILGSLGSNCADGRLNVSACCR